MLKLFMHKIAAVRRIASLNALVGKCQEFRIYQRCLYGSKGCEGTKNVTLIRKTVLQTWWIQMEIFARLIGVKAIMTLGQQNGNSVNAIYRFFEKFHLFPENP